MRKTKKQISLYLCMLLMFVGFLFVMPTETKASDVLKTFMEPDEVWVCENAKELYAGDLIEYSTLKSDGYEHEGYFSERDDIQYKSSKTSVAKINKKTGKITIKKQGTTTIKVEYKGGKLEFTLKVVSEKKMKKKYDELHEQEKVAWEDDNPGEDYYKYYGKTDYSYTIKDAKQLLKVAGSDTRKITSSNRYQILSAISRGWSVGNITKEEYGKKNKRYVYVYSAEALHAYVIDEMLDTYGEERNPFAYNKIFQVKKISGKSGSNQFTIKLDKKITADHIFGSYCHFSWNTDIKNKKEYSYPLYVLDKKTGYRYYAIGTLKQNSDTINVKMKTSKLQKNRQYEVVEWRGKKLPHDEYLFTLK